MWSQISIPDIIEQLLADICAQKPARTAQVRNVKNISEAKADYLAQKNIFCNERMGLFILQKQINRLGFEFAWKKKAKKRKES